MGSEQGHRFTDTVVLLDHGFENYSSVIANHFRNAVKPSSINHAVTATLVPIQMFLIEESENIDIRDLALILNETEENKND